MSQLQVTGEAKIRDIQGPVVANSGVITALDGAANQYVRGDGTLASFPTSGGGGSSVSYYLNGSVNQGTFGGSTYYQMSKNAIVGTGTNFSTSANGLLAQFITDANDPDVVSIPSGNWNVEFFMNVSAASGALASFYVEIYKYNGSTFTLLATNVATPELLTNTTTVDAYFTSVAMPLSSMAITDRLAIRIFTNVASKTVTLYTEDNRLCQVVTTFSNGLTSLNNLTDQSQYLTVGTSGTDFNIVSTGDTHTFNLPVASATNTGKLSSTDWSVFNNKQAALSFTAPLVNTTNTISIPAATSSVDGYLDNLDWTNFNTAYNDSIISAAVTGTTTKTLTLNQQDGGTVTASWTDDNTDAVTSVFGRTGAVVAQSGDYTTTQVTEGTNLYFTDLRSRAALSFAAGSGAYNSTTGVITIPTNTNQLTNGASFITLGSLSAGTGISYNNTTGVISSTITQYTDALARAAISLTTTGTSGAATYNSTTGVLNIPNYAPDLSGYVTLGTAQTISGAKTFTSNIQLGVTTGGGTSTATPLTINLGDTFSNTAGSALKLRLFQNSSGSVLGIGVSESQMDFNVPTGNTYKFWSGNAIFTNNVTAASLIKSGGTSSQYLMADGSVSTLTNPVTGTGTSQFIPKFTGTGSAIGDSIIEEKFGRIAAITVSNNNAVGYEVTNNNSGTTAQSYINLNANSGIFNMGKISTGFTVPAWLSASDAYLYNETAGNIVIYNGATGGFHVKTGGSSTTKLLVTSSGLVGINANPNSALEVKASGATSSIRLGSIVTDALYNAVSLNGTMAEGQYIGIAGGGGSDKALYVNSGTNGNIIFRTGTGTIYNNRMILFDNGDLGIGTSTASFAQADRRVLDINGNDNSIIALSVAGTPKGYIYHNNIAMSIANYTAGQRLNFNTRTAAGVDTTWASILSTGTFLVNTDTGSAGLSDATVTVRASSANVGQTAFSIQGYDNKGRWAINGQNGTDNYDFAIFSAPTGAGDWTQRLTIQADGIVHIGGTVSGGGRLQVNGDVNINGNFKINGTIIGGGGGSGVTGSGTANYVTKWTGASTLGNGLIYDNGNNVIIGATSGTNDSKFEIKGSGVWQGAVMTLTNTGTSGKSISIFSTNSSFTQGAGRLLIYNGSDNVDMLTLTGAGNLMLGTTTDTGHKLSVNGTGRFTGQLNAADGVFAGTVTATSGFFDTSDSRLKIIINDYNKAAGIEKVQARLYFKNGKKELGYFAQDLQEILPSAVSEGDDGFLTLSYIQVHTAKIAYLEEKVAQLEELIKKLL